MGSITTITKIDKATGKKITRYRAYVRKMVDGKSVSTSKVCDTRKQATDWIVEHQHAAALQVLAAQSKSRSTGLEFRRIVDAFTTAPPTRGTKFWLPSHLDFWNQELGDKKITEISRSHINAAVAVLQNKPVERRSITGEVKQTDRQITPATVNRYLASLSSVFNFAIDREIIDVHPLKAGKVRKLKESGGRRRVLTADEEQRLYAAAEVSSWPMMRLFLRVCLTTGARKSEVRNLRWKDVHIEESVAVIPKTKNGEQRALPLVADVKEALLKAKKVRPLQSDFVFFDPKHPEKPKSVDTIWKFVRERAGLLKDRDDPLDQVVLHSTRHTVATKLLKKGANIAQAANITGHKTLAMLKRYTHLAAEDAVELANKMLAK